ncbi:MAG: N-acetylglucosaminyldiphosphoundecaprenol N-acetyl-beta-D-mannosaminyltransferase [Acidimicrobiales bacterium]
MTLASADVRVDVLGVKVSAINMGLAVERIARWIADGEKHYVCVSGAHGVIESQADPELLEIHNRSGLTTPDGMPLVWAGKRAGIVGMERVYGPDLVLALADRAATEQWSFFFYGGAEGVAEEFGQVLQSRYPGLRVAGSFCPPFRPLEEDEVTQITAEINESGADIVLVGLSTPKQERWMASFRPGLEAAALLGVGAAFDFHTDRVRQAPPMVQRLGLEWLFRLVAEPKRLWRRYAIVVPKFMLGIARRPPRIVPE